MLGLLTVCSGFTANAPLGSTRPVAAVSSPTMKEEFFSPVLPGFRPPDYAGGEKTSVQISAFEDGTDYVFFQGPSPKTAVQDDLPDFLSGENLSEIAENLSITPLRLVIGGAFVASAVPLAASLLAAP